MTINLKLIFVEIDLKNDDLVMINLKRIKYKFITETQHIHYNIHIQFNVNNLGYSILLF